MTYTQRRKEIIDKFINIDSLDDLREVEAGLDEFAKYALAEERERVVGIIDWELTPHGYESDDPQFERFAIKIKEKYKNKILSSLDKPLTDK